MSETTKLTQVLVVAKNRQTAAAVHLALGSERVIVTHASTLTEFARAIDREAGRLALVNVEDFTRPGEIGAMAARAKSSGLAMMWLLWGAELPLAATLEATIREHHGQVLALHRGEGVDAAIEVLRAWMSDG
jgi:hypothetical protein